MRWLVAVLAIAATAVLIYLFAAFPYVTDAEVIVTAPDVGMLSFTLVNPSIRTVCLTEVEVMEPTGVKAELHVTEIRDGVVTMKPVDKVCAPPLGRVRLGHMGYHVMLMGPLNSSRYAFLLRLDSTTLTITVETQRR